MVSERSRRRAWSRAPRRRSRPTAGANAGTAEPWRTAAGHPTHPGFRDRAVDPCPPASWSAPREDVTVHPAFQRRHQQQDQDADAAERVDEDVEPRTDLTSVVRRDPVRRQHGEPDGGGNHRDGLPPSSLREQPPGGCGNKRERHQREDLGDRPRDPLCRHARACERGRQPQEGRSEQEQGHPAQVPNREHGEPPPYRDCNSAGAATRVDPPATRGTFAATRPSAPAAAAWAGHRPYGRPAEAWWAPNGHIDRSRSVMAVTDEPETTGPRGG